MMTKNNNNSTSFLPLGRDCPSSVGAGLSSGSYLQSWWSCDSVGCSHWKRSGRISRSHSRDPGLCTQQVTMPVLLSKQKYSYTWSTYTIRSMIFWLSFLVCWSLKYKMNVTSECRLLDLIWVCFHYVHIR